MSVERICRGVNLKLWLCRTERSVEVKVLSSLNAGLRRVNVMTSSATTSVAFSLDQT